MWSWYAGWLACRRVRDIPARLQDAGAEFVKPGIILRRFDLIDKLPIAIRHNVLLPSRVLGELEDVHVKRHVAVSNVKDKVGEPWFRPLVSEFEPLKALEHCLIGIFAGRGRVRPFVITAINGLPELEGLGGLPSAVGRSGDYSRLLIRSMGRGGSRRLGDWAQRRTHFRQLHGCRGGKGYIDLARSPRVKGQIEIEVARVQPFGFNFSARVAHRNQHGIIALKLSGVFNPNGQRVKRVQAGSAQMDLTNILEFA